MSTVTFTAVFSGGQGSLVLDGEGLQPHTTLKTDGPLTCDAIQTAAMQSVTASPVIPQGQAGDTGQVTVEVTDQTGKVLSPAKDNTYVAYKDENGNMVYTFDAYINYAL